MAGEVVGGAYYHVADRFRQCKWIVSAVVGTTVLVYPAMDSTAVHEVSAAHFVASYVTEVVGIDQEG